VRVPFYSPNCLARRSSRNFACAEFSEVGLVHSSRKGGARGHQLQRLLWATRLENAPSLFAEVLAGARKNVGDVSLEQRG
jgi:hypothetical protein